MPGVQEVVFLLVGLLPQLTIALATISGGSSV